MDEDLEPKTLMTTPQFVYGLDSILNLLKKGYSAKIGDTEIYYNGKKAKSVYGNEDTGGVVEYEEFIIRRDIK